VAKGVREVAVLYRDFATQEELDEQYDSERTVANAGFYADLYERESDLLRSQRRHDLRVPYGPTLAEHADIYPTEQGAPVLFYVHGGYWRARTSREFGFVARGPGDRGVATVVPNYALCPAVTIDEILRQTRAALAWTHKNAKSFGGDPNRIHVAGHSAGGHLVAMLPATDWEDEYGLPVDIIKGATAISGLFDLAPFPYTFLQPKLQLTWDQVSRNSPILHLPDSAPPLLVAYGGDETDEFQRQSEDFLWTWKTNGLPGERLVLAGKNHYDVIDGFLDEKSPLLSGIFGLMGLE
jgi:arylformamidase